MILQATNHTDCKVLISGTVGLLRLVVAVPV